MANQPKPLGIKPKSTPDKFDPHAFANDLNRDAENGVLGYTIRSGCDGKPLNLYHIYRQLSSSFPSDVIERTKAEKTKRGYDTTGVKYQAIVDRFNDVLTPWGWSYEIIAGECAESKSADGRNRYEYIIDIAVTVLGRTATHTGSHVSNSKGDAKKGAITNAFKKCSAMFGNGRQVYIGSLDDDNLPIPVAARKVAPNHAHGSQAVAPDVKVSPEELNGICWVGRATKGKKWSELAESSLTVISKFRSDPKAAAVAQRWLHYKILTRKMAVIEGQYPDAVKFKSEVNRLLANGGVDNLWDLSATHHDGFLSALETANDGMKV